MSVNVLQPVKPQPLKSPTVATFYVEKSSIQPFVVIDDYVQGTNKVERSENPLSSNLSENCENQHVVDTKFNGSRNDFCFDEEQ